MVLALLLHIWIWGLLVMAGVCTHPHHHHLAPGGGRGEALMAEMLCFEV